MRIYWTFVILLTLLGAMTQSANAQDETLINVIPAQEAFSSDSNKQTRADLLEALGAYSGPATVESVSAYMSLVGYDVSVGDHKKTRASTLAAAAHFEPVSDVLPRQYIEMKYISAISYFNDRQHRDAMLEMAHVRGFVKALDHGSSETPDWANDLRWDSEAWSLAMRAYFQSARKRYPSEDEISAILLSYGEDAEANNEAAMNEPGETTGLPHCPGRLVQMPRLRYPAGGVMRGKFGAVILGFEFDETGNVINPNVLASIPQEYFDERALKTVGKWRFKAEDSSQVGVTCALERTNVVLPIVFSLG